MLLFGWFDISKDPPVRVSQCDMSLFGWCDSDWASYSLTHRSLTGSIVFLGYSPISWKTKKQHIVSRSLPKRNIDRWLMSPLSLSGESMNNSTQELGRSSATCMSLYYESMYALHIAQNPVFHERTKHIEVDCHYVRDAIRDGIVTTRHVVTRGNLRIFSLRPLANGNFYSC